MNKTPKAAPRLGSMTLDRPGRLGQGEDNLVEELLQNSYILLEDWQALAEETREELRACRDRHVLLPQLVNLGLLTEYQAIRIEAGKTFGLIIGNYRVLDRLGAGGMGVVFRAEHTHLRRQVAIKVLAMSLASSDLVRMRFDSEMRAIAQLQHPNIVTAFDAGDLPPQSTGTAGLHYFVMEYVPGQDLEQYVKTNGPLPVVQACDMAYQIASALAEAHKHGLIHRDLKPSNIQRMPDGRVKLLDFGLARHGQNRVTEPGTILGTVDYMAPEQIEDARGVDARVDIFGLGGTLFWCLTGQPPFPEEESTIAGLLRRHLQSPPSIRMHQPHLSVELDQLVARMMASDPADRYPSAQAVMQALLPFLRGEVVDHLQLTSTARSSRSEQHNPIHEGLQLNGTCHRILLVDDDAKIRQMCRITLLDDDIECEEAPDGKKALAMLAEKPFDLVLLDVMMPGISGLEVCKRIREGCFSPHLKVIMFSGQAAADEMAEALSAGADDFLTKPFSTRQLRARARAALRLKSAQDRSDVLTQHLMAVNKQLEEHLNARDGVQVQMRNAMVTVLAKLVEHRQVESSMHLHRMQRYCRLLAEEMARLPSYMQQIDEGFIQMLEQAVLLHDIGSIGLPDHILHKPGKLDTDERVLMQTHTVLGANLLEEVVREHGSVLPFLQMGIDVARHHHERWDGKGYPDRLKGNEIPLAARLVALPDVYDALRCPRVYKPALTHATALHLILNMPGQFDPVLLEVFQSCHPQFEKIFREMPN